MDPPIPEKKDPPIITESHSTIEERMDPPDALELNGGAPAGENDNDNDGLDIHVNIARSVTGSAPTDIVHDHNNNNNDGSSSKLHPMEIEMESEEDDGDMESLLSSSGNPVSSQPKQKRMQQKPAKTYLNGWIKPQPIGNMQILFPEYFHSSGWGVLGPHWFGPACIWLILVVATHLCLRRAHHLGSISVWLCYGCMAASTYLLTDVSFRDPGICMDREIPPHTTNSEASQWRWCDFCNVYQPPDGSHCPECNVCVAGYDHHCVWMGTCIGRKNHRQFVRFNVSWLYYVGFATIWLLTFGPLFKGGN